MRKCPICGTRLEPTESKRVPGTATLVKYFICYGNSEPDHEPYMESITWKVGEKEPDDKPRPKT